MSKGPGRVAVAAAMMLFVLGAYPALSRQWKATPDALIRDYAVINDQRPGGELVLAMWFVPRMIPANSAGADVAKAMLQKYVVIAVAHGRLQSATGTMSFDNVDALTARNQSGQPLTLVAKDSLPPTNVAMVSALESFLRQTLGTMGSGMKMFVFDAADVGSCERGQLSLLFANETYTWNTPFPGCQQD
jgi:hypothetical protein